MNDDDTQIIYYPQDWEALTEAGDNDPVEVSRQSFDAYVNHLGPSQVLTLPRFEQEGFDTALNYDEKRWWVCKREA